MSNKSKGYKISILRGVGAGKMKRGLLTGTPKWDDPTRKRQTMTFKSRRAAEKFVKSLTPNTISVYKPHIIKPRKRKKK